MTNMQVLEEANELFEQDPAEARELLKRFSLSIRQLVSSIRFRTMPVTRAFIEQHTDASLLAFENARKR